MLVLSRRVDQRIVILHKGTILEIQVCVIKGDRVRLGFEAPSDVRIFRKELIEQEAENNGIEDRRIDVEPE